ncbi:MAG: glucose 1-dehydrogenase [Alphaproteobacteria bacterium]|jgi:gluconate 5-dehydrogenase|nr:glucose 1-dehydrogenase [Rhodospirillaceae bacterium]MBT6510173.1 glucose 1-dehydrogenase [Rhodospirillaceae bacterium]MBT7647864.1 glucose 1-dehydrogenase [Rhodospirillaceae bacterium]MDG2482346.1 glucose 1-dehydrogenase [Alphaproteobacteria bacterium]
MTSNPMFDLSGRTAIVTGAGRGLGAEMARGLAAAGANVVLAARTQASIDGVAATISEAGGSAHAVACDATKRRDVEHLVAAAVERFGALDIMVVNHGLGPAKDLLEVTDEDLDAVIGTNLNSAFVCAQLAGKQMIAQGRGGAVIITSSSASQVACWGYSYYGASKGGVDQLVRQLAQEWAPHRIRVNAINPGYTENEMAGTGDVHDTPEVAQFIDRFIPLGRRGEAHEMAGPVVFLASDAASYVTGHCLFVDGGYAAV